MKGRLTRAGAILTGLVIGTGLLVGSSAVVAVPAVLTGPVSPELSDTPPPPAEGRLIPAPAVDENHSMTAAPEHFDRVRTEQFEKEEDRLRKRSRN